MFVAAFVSHYCTVLSIPKTTVFSRDNWQEMVTEEIKTLFRKANRQVDKQKV